MADENKKGLATSVQDVRKMRRSLKMRKEQDPEVVAETLDTVLKEAIAVRSMVGGRLGKGAENELRNIRRSLVAGQINPGDRTTEFVGKYSAIIDRIDKSSQKAREEEGGSGPGVGQAIAQNLPSADMLTSALITANPLMGYSVKIAKDVFSSAIKRRARNKKIQQKELENLRAEETQLEEKHSNSEPGSEREGELTYRLEDIRNDIQRLVRATEASEQSVERIHHNTESSVHDREGQNERLESIDHGVEETYQSSVEERDDQSSLFERLTDSIEEQGRLQRETAEDNGSRLEAISGELSNQSRQREAEASRGRLRREEGRYEGRTFGAGNIAKTPGAEAEQGDSPLGGLGQWLTAGLGGSIGGLVSGTLAKLFAPFRSVIRFFTKGGSILGRLGRASGMITAVYAIYDFVSGFMSAEDIIDKDGELNVHDRIRAGVSSVIAGLLTPIDWVLDFVGLGFMEDKDSFTKKIANSENELMQFMLSPLSWIVEYIENHSWEDFYEDLKDAILAPFDLVLDTFNSISDVIGGWIDEKLEWFNNTWFGDAIQETSEMMSETAAARRNPYAYAEGGVEAVEEAEREAEERRAANDPWSHYSEPDFSGRGDNEPSEPDNKLEEEPTESRRKLEEEEPGLSKRDRIGEAPKLTSQSIQSALQVTDQLGSKGNSGIGGTSIVAPNNSQSTVVNNNSVNGPSSSENEDRSWRRYESLIMGAGMSPSF